MRDAAVGFQCPSCVSDGAKQTRSGRTAYGGARSDNPALTSQVLIALNAAVFLLIAATGGAAGNWVNRLALLPTGRCELTDGSGRFLPFLAESQCATSPGSVTWIPGVSDGAYWQLVTSMFTHVQVFHIALNMLALWLLGPQLEAVLGRVRFLALYMLSGLSGSAMVYWLSGATSTTLGASGAIFGLMAALLMVAYKVRADVSGLLRLVALNFLITVVGSSFISWQGHLGGFLGGLVVAGALIYAPRNRRSRWQALGAAAFAAVLVASIVARSLVLAG